MPPILQNILLGITLAAPLGPATLTIIKTGIRGGFLAAILTALGVVAADTTYVLVAYFGLAQVITIPIVKTGILVFGMFVLAYLGYKTIKDAPVKKDVADAGRGESRSFFFQGYAVNISNPVAVVWWLGLIGSILAASDRQSDGLSALFYSLTVVIGILIWHTGLSAASHFSKKFLGSKVLMYISVVSGVVLFGFALRFGYQALLSLM